MKQTQNIWENLILLDTPWATALVSRCQTLYLQLPGEAGVGNTFDVRATIWGLGQG